MSPALSRALAGRPPPGPAAPRPEAAHEPSSRRRLRVAATLLASCGAAAGLAVLLPGLPLAVKNGINAWAYPPASVGAGLVLLAASRTLEGRARRAWALLGLGVLCWGIGEVGSEFYWAAGRAVPYPGWVDVAFLLGYPLIAAGVASLPRPRLGRFERLRAALDAAAGIVALSLLAWLLYLDRSLDFAPGASLLENWTNAAYPVFDALLLLAVMSLAFSRSEHSPGRDLLALGAALALNAVADLTYWALLAAGRYADGMWIDGAWLLGYATLALAGRMSMAPARAAAPPAGRPTARLVAAYLPVLAWLAVVAVTEAPGRRYLTAAGMLLGALIVARQWVANRETREIVEGARDALLASVSHDVRTPLAAVQGYSELLAAEWEEYPPAERQEMLQTIKDQAEHLAKLVTDIIDVTRGRTGTVVLSRTPFPADRLLQRAVGALPRPAAEEVAVEAEAGLVADVDADRIHQVLVNLLSNALRYGRPPLLARAARAGNHILFQVHDSGPGVPKRHEASIWQRFERGAHRNERSVGGLGLGLAIAKSMVEAHGGAIGQRRSERFGGACFEFTIPAALPTPGAAVVRHSPAAASPAIEP